VAAALQIWSHTFSKTFDDLPSGIRETVQRKIDDMGTRLENFPHQRRKAGLNSSSVSAITACFTNSTQNSAAFISTTLATAARFINEANGRGQEIVRRAIHGPVLVSNREGQSGKCERIFSHG
jgi:hypothetical protein